jgi:cyclic pyranopterin phosphate synthase
MQSADEASVMSGRDDSLTHLDRSGRPAMVDIGDKAITSRSAEAAVRVEFPPDVAAALRRDALRVAKGGVVETAVIAGTQAVKRTAELIPFCHPLPIHGCRIEIDWIDECVLGIRCRVRTEHRTGVEMEALTGASVAALTIYDMCKALSHEIVIREARLVSKRGGKRDLGADDGD